MNTEANIFNKIIESGNIARKKRIIHDIQEVFLSGMLW